MTLPGPRGVKYCSRDSACNPNGCLSPGKFPACELFGNARCRNGFRHGRDAQRRPAQACAKPFNRRKYFRFRMGGWRNLPTDIARMQQCAPKCARRRDLSLVPYVNRIRGGQFTFRGQEVRLDSEHAGRSSPLHGQGWLNAWTVEAASARAAALTYRHHAGEWPWDYEARQEFSLDERGISRHPLLPQSLGKADAVRAWLSPLLPMLARYPPRHVRGRASGLSTSTSSRSRRCRLRAATISATGRFAARVSTTASTAGAAKRG